MRISPRISQCIWLLVAAGLLAGAGLVGRPLGLRRDAFLQAGGVVTEQNPEMAVYELLPGALKVFWINYEWIRAEELKNDGRYFDAMQRAARICRLQPRFAGVWAFQAWNMSWNISVATHTPQERWRWVYGGVRLLRDDGIPLNPKSLLLYKELAWIFFSKMGGTTDEMHRWYKRRWAGMMQRTLGAPAADPVLLARRERLLADRVKGSFAEADLLARLAELDRRLNAPTGRVLDAFAPIAEAPLDKTRRRQGRVMIQADQRDIVLKDPEVAAYAAALAKLGVDVDESLLEAYNRFSRDDAVAVARVAPPVIATDGDKAISERINDPAHVVARGKLLAFVRAQVLWNRYKMDPGWMMQMMRRYGPIDWRLVWPHGLYWSTYGMHIVAGLSMADIDTLNTGLIVLGCLKDLTWQGRLTYREKPTQPDWPDIWFHADWRFIDHTQAEYMRLIGKVIKDRDQAFRKNIYKDGHINYLINAVEMLYAGYRHAKARGWYDWIKTYYKPNHPDYELDLNEFVITRITRDGSPIAQLAYGQMTAAIQTAYVLQLQGDLEGARHSLDYARRVYRAYQKDAPPRLKIKKSMGVFMAQILTALVVSPQASGYDLSVQDRSRLYESLPDRMQCVLYDTISRVRAVRQQCRQRGLDFNRLFPIPKGYAAHLANQGRRFDKPEDTP